MMSFSPDHPMRDQEPPDPFICKPLLPPGPGSSAPALSRLASVVKGFLTALKSYRRQLQFLVIEFILIA